jgi:transposase
MARRKYTPEFKREAVRLVREENMTYAQVGADLGIDKSTIRDWCKLSEAGKLEVVKSTGAGSRSMEEENAALRREVRILREEREILKKAAAFFARETR